MALNVSLFAKDNEPTPHLRVGLTFSELVENIGPPRSYLAKNAAPMYSPAEWLPGYTRSKEGIACVHFGVLDIDHWTQDALVALITTLRTRGLAYYIASTWSNGEQGEEDVCARLIMPLTRPVLFSEWPRFWRGFNEEFTRGSSDGQAKDASRAYYAPSFCEGRALPPFSVANVDGEAVDVDAIAAKVGGLPGVDFGAAPTTSAALTRDALKALGRKFLASKKENLQEIGRLVARIVKGAVYAREPETLGSVFDDGFVAPEGRNDTTFRIIARICEHFPHAEPQTIVDLFKPSTALMGGPEDHEIYSMIERLQAGAKQAHASLIKEAIGRHEPYTDAELQALTDRAEIPLSTLRRRWIIQKDRSYYVLRPDGYRHYTEKEARKGAHVDLAPAIRAGVDTMKIMQSGPKPKSIEELVDDYGAIASGGVLVDLTAQFSHFEEDTRTFIEASCPIRVQPREHPDVDAWLRVFAGPKYERLRQWLAVLPALNEPCAALYLEGEKGVGKSLLACGAARIWSDKGPTAMKNVMGTNFNDSLVRCPLVFADEKAPTDERGRVRTDDLREFIQARERPLNRKYRDTATIKGCVRVVFAANNRNLLQTSEHLTEADIAAIVERIFYIPVNIETRDYLKALPKGVTDRWVQGNAIAEHAMFLSQTLEVPRTSRFLVAGEASDLTNSLAVGTGQRASVAYWLVSYLLDPQKFSRSGKAHSLMPLVRVSRGRFMVSSRAIAEAWDLYVAQDREPPKPMEVARALAGLSVEITLYIAGKNHKFRHVNMDLLAEWAEQTGYGTRESLDEALVKIEAGTVVVPGE